MRRLDQHQSRSVAMQPAFRRQEGTRLAANSRLGYGVV
jgi:hypothetical protein